MKKHKRTKKSKKRRAMTIRTVKFKPRVMVTMNDETGQFSMDFDWADANQGEYDENGDGLGWSNVASQADAWISDVVNNTPHYRSYPPMQHNPLLGQLAQPDNEPKEMKRAKNAGSFPTCAHFQPSDKAIEAGVTPIEKWPFDKHLPYHTCTNKDIVGPLGYGQCRIANSEMPQCNGYKAEEARPEGVGESKGVPVFLERRRVGLGAPEWKLRRATEDGGEQTATWVGADAAAHACAALAKVSDTEPTMIKAEPRRRPFLAAMVGAASED